jgi:hypothetical protein
MNSDFEDQIIAIAQSYKNQEELKSIKLQSDSHDKVYLQAMDHLFLISQQAVNIFNSNSESEVLSAYKLPKEFLEMFLEIPGRRGGSSIISPNKIIIFFDEEPNTITVIGKIRNNQSGVSQNSVKVAQLLKATFSNKEGGFKYKDNTGGTLDPYDIVALLIKWVVT